MAKQNGHLLVKPRRPRQPQNGVPTAVEAQAYQDYIQQLRDWLNSLSEAEHDRAIKKLPGAELDQVINLDTYENYQKGGPLRELLEGTCFEGTL